MIDGADMKTFRVEDMEKCAWVLQETAMREPAVITQDARPQFVLMSIQEYARLRRMDVG
jgi:prevent-host-death family protein